MSTKLYLALVGMAVWLAISHFGPVARSQSLPGLPEPGLVMYGTVSGTNGNRPISSLRILWRTASGSIAVTNPATVVNVNGQSFYVLHVSFETRSIAGTPSFSATPNTLELIVNGATYTRSATVNGTNATLLGPTSFTFGGADRGRVDRLDLQVNLPPETFSEWAQRYFGTPSINQNTDPLGKGMTYYQQYVAGTDPLDPNSVFKFVSITPAQPTGIIIEWASVVGKNYAISRSAAAAFNYTYIATNLVATNILTNYRDATATGPGPYFYRLQVQ
jgi:hypothetical protein